MIEFHKKLSVNTTGKLRPTDVTRMSNMLSVLHAQCIYCCISTSSTSKVNCGPEQVVTAATQLVICVAAKCV